MNCHQAGELFDDYISGSMDEVILRSFLEHLDSCSDCRQAIEEEKKLLDILHEEEIPDPGENYWKELESAIINRIGRQPSDTAPTVYRHVQPAHSSWLYLIPLAASIMILIASINNLGLRSGSPLQADGSVAHTVIFSSGAMDGFLMADEIRSELLGSIVMSPPGSFGMKALAGRMSDLR